MAAKPAYKKLLDHCDKDEIVSKMIIGISPADINSWLKAKYTNVGEEKFVLSEMMLKNFKNNYLDFYNDMQQDLSKTKKAVKGNSHEELELTVKGNSAYKDALIKIANNELDVNQMMARMALNVETRVSQIFDTIQEDSNNINPRLDRILIEYVDSLGSLLDKYHKWSEAPVANQFIQNNLTVNVIDSHIEVFRDVIKQVLAQMDLESSLYFMELFNEKMSQLKMPEASAVSPEIKMAEVQLLNQTINKKLNE
jgi:hypothetical protein